MSESTGSTTMICLPIGCKSHAFSHTLYPVIEIGGISVKFQQRNPSYTYSSDAVMAWVHTTYGVTWEFLPFCVAFVNGHVFITTGATFLLWLYGSIFATTQIIPNRASEVNITILVLAVSFLDANNTSLNSGGNICRQISILIRFILYTPHNANL